MTNEEWEARIELLRKVEKTWKENVARLIENWRTQHGYATKDDFAAALGIGSSVYTTISLAQSVSGKDVYARMYLLTGIETLHPMQIPASYKKIPRGYAHYERKMTQQEWDAWLEEHKDMFRRPQLTSEFAVASVPVSQPPAIQPQVQAQPNNLQPIVQTNGLTQQIESLLTTFSATVAEHVAQKLKAQGHPVLQDISQADIPQLIQHFEAFLKRYVAGSAQDRDWLFRTYGGVLAAMQPLLDILTTGDEEDRIRKTHIHTTFNGKEQ